MIFLITIFQLLAASSYAISLNDAIYSVGQNSPEIQAQNLSHKITKSNSIELAQKTLPTVYLYYNYSKPGTPNFKSTNASGGGAIGSFVTGLVQNNYGIAAEYNIFGFPQLLIKAKSAHNATKASLASTQNKKNEFYYNLAQTYIALYRAQNTLELQEKILATAKARYNEIKQYFTYGRSNKKDLLSAESAFLTANANFEKYTNELKVAQQKYVDKFSVLHTDLTIPDVSLSLVAQNIDDLKQTVQEKNQDLKSLTHAAKSYGAESYISAIDLLPTVTVGYREAYTKVDPILAIPDYTQGTFYINARMDLLNMTKYLSTFRYNNEKNRKISEAKIAKKNYVTEAEALWYNTKHQESMIDVLQKVVANSQEVYEITRREVQYGSKSFTDELQAKQDYTTSQLQLLEAKLQKAENIYRLKYLTGGTM